MATEHRALVVKETAINIAINMAFSVVFFVLPFYGRSIIDWWGARGLAVDFLPQIFFVACAAWLAPTLTTAHRLRRGKIAAVNVAHVPGTRAIIVHSLLIAIAAAIVLGGVCIGLVKLLGVVQIGFMAALMMKTIVGGIVALLIVPIAMRAILRTAQLQTAASHP